MICTILQLFQFDTLKPNIHFKCQIKYAGQFSLTIFDISQKENADLYEAPVKLH